MAKLRRNNDVKLLGFVRRNRSALLTGTALQAAALLVLALPAEAQPAPNARPLGGTVVGGSASISRGASNTTINQSTQRAAVDWQSFDVGSQQSVTFNQPSASSVTLNRVTGPDPSQIAGRIDANGQIILVNQSGVTFYQGAQVNTNGLMVTAAGISNANFMAGVMRFDQPAQPNAKIDNQGNITIKQAGLAALVAPQVANSGTISARLGHVVLAGAKTATLDLYGDGLLSLDVTNQVTQAPSGATALVTNTGVIVADGGTVQLTARAADGVVQNLVQAGGNIRAASIGNHVGTVALNGVGGSIIVEGQLSAPGIAPGTQGGAIEVVTTGNVTVASTAKIDASGKAGGGVVAIGTTLARAKGGPSVKPAVVAANTVVQPGATISANATAKGDGGTVTVLSDATTTFSGTILAQGGPNGGDGGIVETSGVGYLFVTSTAAVSAAAAQGKPGQWLLDPDSNIDITSPSTNPVANPSAGVYQPVQTAAGNSSTLDPAVIQAALTAGTSVVVTTSNPAGTQAGNIRVGVTPGGTDGQISGFTAPNAVSLTLNAGSGGGAGSITVNSPISDSGSPNPLSLVLNAGGGIAFSNTVTIGGSLNATAAINNPAGAITINTGGAVSATAGITLTAGKGGITLASNVTGTTIDLNATGGGVSQTAGALTATTLQSTSGVTGTVNLARTANNIASLGFFAVTSGNFTLVDNGNTGNLTISGPVTATNVTISDANTGTISVSGSIGATTELALSSGSGGIALTTGEVLSGATIDLSATGGGVTQVSTGTITAGTILQSTSGVIGTVNLAGTANNVASVGSFAVTSGNFTLVDNGNTGNLTVSGPVTATNVTISDANTGTISVSGSIGATTALALSSGSGGIAMNTGEVLSGATIDLSATGGGVTQVSTGTIAATILQSTSGVTGTVNLAGTANNVASLGSFAVTSGNFTLVDNGNTGNLAVSGPVTATNVTLANANTGTISVSGSIGATTALALSSGSGGIALNTGEVLSGATIDLSATGGGVTQVSTGTIAATILQSTSGVTGTVNLAGTANNVASVGSFAVTGGNFTLVDNGNTGNLAVSGPLTATNVTISDANTGTISVSGSIGATTVLALSSGSGGIALNTGEVLSGATIDLSAAGGGVTEVASGTIAATILQSTSGVTGTVNLAGTANNVASVGSFAVTGGNFTLVDNGNTGKLAVSGPLTATNVTISDANTGTISVSGSIGATTALALSSGSGGIALNTGEVLSGATIDLSATGGGVTQVATGTITAGTILQSTSGVIGTVNLAGTKNNVASLGSFAVTGGNFTLVDDGNTGNLAVSGPVTATNVTISDANTGTISVSGSIGATGALVLSSGSGGIAPNTGEVLSGATIDLSATGGGVTQVATGTITAGTILQSTSGVIGTVNLAGTKNNVASLGSFAVTGGNFTLVDNGNTGNLAVSGPVTATNVTISDANTGTIRVSGSIGATGVLVLSSGSGGIALNTGDVLSGATIDLSATGGGVTQVSTGTIIAATILQSTSGVTGTVNLAGTKNNVASVGSFAVTGGNFTLVDNGNTGNLAVSGPVTATNVTISDANTGTISVSGSIGATTALALSSGSGGIALNTGDVLSGATVDLSATGGGVTQVSTGTIIAATLQSSANVNGNVSLRGTANAIGSLGNFAVIGGGNGFALDDSVALTVAGAVTAPGNVYLETTAGGIAIAAAGTVGVGATALASFQADAFSNAGTVTGGTFEWAPQTALATQTLPSISGVGTTNLRIGAVTVPGTGLTTRAGSIVVGGNFGSLAQTLELDSAGGISESGAAALTAATLTGNAGGTVALTNANTIAALGNFLVTGGKAFTLNDAGENGNLSITGSVAASGVTIHGAGTTTVTGAINASDGTLQLASGSGGILLNGALLSGGTVDLDTAGGGITQSGGGSITASMLLSSGGVSGAVDLGSFNEVGTLGAFTASGGFLLSDASSPSLLVTGPVIAHNVTIAGAQTITVSGSIGATTALALSSGSGGIAFGGTANLSAPTIDLSATGGGVREAATTVISAGTLQSTGGVTGSVDLSGPLNAIANLGAFVVSGGDFMLVDSGGLTVIGGVGANNIGVTTLGSGRIDVQAEMLASGGIIALTSGTGGVVVGTGGSVLGLSLIYIDGSSGGIAISGTGNIGSASGVVDLNTTGGITEDATATLNAGVLQSSLGVSGDVSLPNAAVANIGNFIVTGGSFTLNDSASLSVFGALTATKSATIVDAGTLTVSGTIGAPAISLTAGEIDIPGLVTDGGSGTVNLAAKAGSITETGTLIAGTLTGSIAAGGTLFFFGDLSGATPTTNQIATLGNFTAVSLKLDDGRDLTVAGTITTTTPGSATINAAGTLTVAGAILGALVTLGADRIDIPGLINVGTFELGLNAGTGGISETGTLIAALLSGYSSGPASFIGSNSIGAVPGFTASSFTLNDSTSLQVGNLNGGSSVAIDTTGFLGITGPLTGDVVSLTGTGISIVLGLTGTTSVSLTATDGGISGVGVVNTPLLSGSATGSVFLAGLNTIATLGDFTAAGFTLRNNKDLSINGTLAGGPFVSIDNGASLTVNGSITASSVSLAGANLTIPGFVSDGGDGTTSLIATAGTIGETGTLIAGTLSGSSIGATNLTGETTTTNQVAALGNFGAAIFNLNDGTNLTIGGSVNGGPLAGILDNGVLTIGGTLAATNIGLTAFSLAIPGTVSDGGSGSVSLHATAGAINETGTLIAGILGGDATAAASFTGASPTANRVATLGGFSSTGFTLNDGSDLTIDATVNGGPSIAIAGAGSISETAFGALLATTLTGSAGGAASFTGANRIATLADFSASGFALNDTTNLTIAGTLNGGPSAQLISAGAINETGTIIASTLSGSAGGPANFIAANQLGALGNFTAAGFTLTNNQDLTIAGSVNGGTTASIGVTGALSITGNVTANTVLLTATGNITIPGSVIDANSVTLTAGGSIDETGTLVADLLTGSAAGNASLTGGGNQVANLGSFTAGGSFSLTDATDLLISATLTAPKIVINAGGNQITLADGATIVTGGTARPPGVSVNLPTATNSANGAFLSAGNFVQLGNSFLDGLSGGPNIVRIDVSGGKISLDQTGGLQAPQTWLILGLTSGKATGNLFVQTLDLQYAGASSASLTGSIVGLTGPAAAGAAGILPAPNADFRFNACVISSVNCVLLPSEKVPTANPLNDLDIGTLSSTEEQDDLLLPIVSDWDY